MYSVPNPDWRYFLNKGCFLSIVTRTCQRPVFLRENIQSVKAQADRQNIEQIFIVDRQRAGVHTANKSFALNKDRVIGEFCFILDDDCWLINDHFVEHLKAFVSDNPEAKLIMFKSKRPAGPPSNETIFPTAKVWRKTLVHGTTNGLCYAIESSIWRKYIKHFGTNAGGDWWFLKSVLDSGVKIYWLDELMGEARQLGRGNLFEPTKPGWFERVAKEQGLENLGKDDWRFRPWKEYKCRA